MKKLIILTLTIILFSCSNNNDEIDSFNPKDIPITENLNAIYNLGEISLDLPTEYGRPYNDPNKNCSHFNILYTELNELSNFDRTCQFVEFSFFGNNKYKVYTSDNWCSLPRSDHEDGTYELNGDIITFSDSLYFFKRMMPDIDEIIYPIKVTASKEYVLLLEFEYKIKEDYKIFSVTTNTAKIVLYQGDNARDNKIYLGSEVVMNALGLDTYSGCGTNHNPFSEK